MKLRSLKLKDAGRMLAWMHDDDVCGYLNDKFAEKSLSDCKNFIEYAKNDKFNLHYAITDESDLYLGTVSLKNINNVGGYSELAIVTMREAMGKGYSKFAMQQIISVGFEKLKLTKIFWCVVVDNIRAIKFYEKCGFNKTDKIPTDISKNYTLKNLLWFFTENRNESD